MLDEMYALLKSRGVSKQDLVECVYYLQKPYIDELTSEQIDHYVDSVLNKREVQHVVMTGIALDVLAEQGKLGNDKLQEIILKDYGLYGVDEVMAYGICNLYGSIALTNFGYIDKIKPGVVGRLNKHDQGHCHTFLDDIVGAIAAAAAGKLAHDKESV